MVEITHKLTPTSSGSFAIGFVAANLLLTPVGAPGVDAVGRIQPTVTIAGSLGSFGNRRDPFAEMIVIPREQTSLVGFYADLLLQQEELGQEFAKVLYDNVWDLYAR